MLKIAFATATAAAFITVVPMVGGASPAHAQNLKTAQVDIEVGRDRDRDRDRVRREHEGVSVGVGPGGVRVGPRHREHCRTVTTTMRRDDGSRVRRTERRCD